MENMYERTSIVAVSSGRDKLKGLDEKLRDFKKPDQNKKPDQDKPDQKKPSLDEILKDWEAFESFYNEMGEREKEKLKKDQREIKALIDDELKKNQLNLDILAQLKAGLKTYDQKKLAVIGQLVPLLQILSPGLDKNFAEFKQALLQRQDELAKLHSENKDPVPEPENKDPVPEPENKDPENKDPVPEPENKDPEKKDPTPKSELNPEEEEKKKQEEEKKKQEEEKKAAFLALLEKIKKNLSSNSKEEVELANKQLEESLAALSPALQAELKTNYAEVLTLITKRLAELEQQEQKITELKAKYEQDIANLNQLEPDQLAQLLQGQQAEYSSLSDPMQKELKSEYQKVQAAIKQRQGELNKLRGDIVIGSVSEKSLRAQAKDQALEQDEAEGKDPKNSGFFRRLWRGFTKTSRQARLTAQILEQMKQQGSLSAKGGDQAEIKAITDRLLTAEGIQEEAGEQRLELTGAEHELVRKFLTEAAQSDNIDWFNAERSKLLTTLKAKHPDLVEQIDIMGDNLLDRVQDLRELNKSGKKIADLHLENIKIYLAKASAGVRTEADLSRVDGIIERLSKIPVVGGLLGTKTMAGVLGGLWGALGFASTGALRAVASPLGLAGGAAISGGVAGYRENIRQKQERAWDARRRAQGKAPEKTEEEKTNADREKERFHYESKSAQELLDELNSKIRALTEANKLPPEERTGVYTANYKDALSVIFKLEQRERLANENKIDLINFAEGQVERQRCSLAVAKASLKVALNKAAQDWQNNSTLDAEFFKTQEQEVKAQVQEEERGELNADISKKDEAFARYKFRRVAWAAVKAAATTAVVGGLSRALVNWYRHGISPRESLRQLVGSPVEAAGPPTAGAQEVAGSPVPETPGSPPAGAAEVAGPSVKPEAAVADIAPAPADNLDAAANPDLPFTTGKLEQTKWLGYDQPGSQLNELSLWKPRLNPKTGMVEIMTTAKGTSFGQGESVEVAAAVKSGALKIIFRPDGKEQYLAFDVKDLGGGKLGASIDPNSEVGKYLFNLGKNGVRQNADLVHLGVVSPDGDLLSLATDTSGKGMAWQEWAQPVEATSKVESVVENVKPNPTIPGAELENSVVPPNSNSEALTPNQEAANAATGSWWQRFRRQFTGGDQPGGAEVVQNEVAAEAAAVPGTVVASEDLAASASEPGAALNEGLAAEQAVASGDNSGAAAVTGETPAAVDSAQERASAAAEAAAERMKEPVSEQIINYSLRIPGTLENPAAYQAANKLGELVQASSESELAVLAEQLNDEELKLALVKADSLYVDQARQLKLSSSSQAVYEINQAAPELRLLRKARDQLLKIITDRKISLNHQDFDQIDIEKIDNLSQELKKTI